MGFFPWGTLVVVAASFLLGAAAGALKLRIHKKVLASLFADADKKARRKALLARILMQVFTFALMTAATILFGLPSLLACAAGLLAPTVALVVRGG